MIKTKMLAAFVAASAVLYGGTSAESNDTTWSPEYNKNNTDISKKLCVPGATTLSVTISGETERNFDFIYVNDTKGQKFSGPLSEEFEVSGPCVIARFTTDTSVIRGEGPTVSIAKKDDSVVTWKPEYKEEGPTNVTKKLCIKDAHRLDVRITGETEENSDYITINSTNTDSYNTTFNRSFSGLLNVHARTKGPCAYVRFTTDSTTKTGDGPTVTVTESKKYGLLWEPEYTNNADENIELCHFASLNNLTLKIMGETEGTNDILTVNEKYKFSGLHEDTPMHSKIGSIPTKCVRLRFQTNGSVIQGKGLKAMLYYLAP